MLLYYPLNIHNCLFLKRMVQNLMNFDIIATYCFGVTFQGLEGAQIQTFVSQVQMVMVMHNLWKSDLIPRLPDIVDSLVQWLYLALVAEVYSSQSQTSLQYVSCPGSSSSLTLSGNFLLYSEVMYLQFECFFDSRYFQNQALIYHRLLPYVLSLLLSFSSGYSLNEIADDLKHIHLTIHNLTLVIKIQILQTLLHSRLIQDQQLLHLSSSFQQVINSSLCFH